MFRFARREVLAGALAIACTGFVSVAHCIPFNSAITISGSVALDTVNSFPSSGNANQSGSLSAIAGGAPTSSTITELTVAGSNPVAQALTDINDRLGIRFLVDGAYDMINGAATSGPLFGDYTISLSNSSVIDTFEISLGISLTQILSAAGVTSAYVEGEFVIKDAGLNDVAYAKHTRDTLFGDVDVPLSTGSLLVALAPGQSAVFGGRLRLEGGAISADGDSYSGDIDAQIFVAGVRQLGVQRLPAPGTVALLALGLGFIAIRRRHPEEFRQG